VTPTTRDALAELLADHEPNQTSYDARDLHGCECGFATSRHHLVGSTDPDPDWAEYHRHVADVVLAYLERVA
jgi:hypothetical protein